MSPITSAELFEMLNRPRRLMKDVDVVLHKVAAYIARHRGRKPRSYRWHRKLLLNRIRRGETA